MFFNFFTFFLFFLISKEFLFYGEERLIVLSYLTLFVMLFFTLSDSMVDSFNSRATALKAEFDGFFESILLNLNKAKTLLLNFSFFNLKILRLFNAIFLEFVFYFSNRSTFFFTKFNFLKYNFNNVLSTSSSVVIQLNSVFYNKVLPVFFNSLLVWKSGAGINWIRPRVLTSQKLSVTNNSFSSSYWFLNNSGVDEGDLFLPTFKYNFSVKNIK